MKKADQFIFPTAFTGNYPNSWAGYIFLQMTQQNALHPGIDWNWGAVEADYGQPVQCIANGQVVHQSRQDGVGYGIIVVVKHELTDELYNFIKTKYQIDTRNIYSFYAHLKDEIVDDNQELDMGELVGYVGKSGTTVSHLHQELYKAIPGTSWRYWPTLSAGWTAEKLKQYYIDTYDLVVNQPTSNTSNDDLLKSRADAFVAVADKLQKPVDKDIVLADIDKFLKYESLLVEKDRLISEKDSQLTIVTDKVDDLDDRLQLLDKENIELKTSIQSLTDGNKIQSEDIQKLKLKVEELQKIQPIEQLSSLELVLTAVKRFLRRR